MKHKSPVLSKYNIVHETLSYYFFIFLHATDFFSHILGENEGLTNVHSVNLQLPASLLLLDNTQKYVGANPDDV